MGKTRMELLERDEHDRLMLESYDVRKTWAEYFEELEMVLDVS